MTSNQKLMPGEALFVRYLREQSYSGWNEHEPEFPGCPSNPDFLIATDGAECVCEVKEFTTDYKRRDLRRSRHGRASWSAKRTLQPVRDALRRAANQLKPLADGDRPLVVVLTNPHNADVDLRVREVVHAMYGDPTFQLHGDESGTVESSELFAGRNGELTNSHPHLGAVACLRWRNRADDWWDEQPGWEEQWKRQMSLGAGLPWEDPPDVPRGNYVAIDLIETQSAVQGHAVPVPDHFFNGPDDTRWSLDDDSYGPRSLRANDS